MINNRNSEVLSEFYTIIYLNQLKIVDPPLQIRTSMAKVIVPFRGSHAPYWFSGPRTDVPVEPPTPLIGPTYTNNGPPETVTTNNTKYRGGSRISSYGGAREAEGGAKNFGVFRVKKHDFTPKNHILSNCGGRRETFWGISCEKSRFYAKKIIFFSILGGERAGCAPPGSAPEININSSMSVSDNIVI